MHKIITTLPLKTWNALAGAVRPPAQNDHEVAQCLFLGANVAAVTDGHYAMVRVVQGAPARTDDLPFEATLSAIPYATLKAVAKTKQPSKAGAWMVRVGLGEADRPTVEILNEHGQVQSTILFTFAGVQALPMIRELGCCYARQDWINAEKWREGQRNAFAFDPALAVHVLETLAKAGCKSVNPVLRLGGPFDALLYTAFETGAEHELYGIWACAIMPMRGDEYQGRDGAALLARFAEFADKVDKSGKR